MPTASPVPVRFESIRLERLEGSRAAVELTVSSGTYVRAFAHDVGAQLGCGAHVEALRRTAVGPLSVDGAWTPDALAALRDQGRLESALLPPVDALAGLPLLRLSPDDVRRVRHGQGIDRRGEVEPGRTYRLVDGSNALVAIGLARAGGVRPTVVLA